MMNSQREPITTHDLFRNVRKAYRLLHDYQCMVRDAVRYISAQIDITSEGGYVNFAGDARAACRYLEDSSWDWLPMMGFEFHFLKRFGPVECLSLTFYIMSDTGFFEGCNKENDIEALSDYAPADKSSTKFAFILRKSHWHPSPPFIKNKVQMRDFIKEGGSLPDELVKEGYVGKCYDMSCLASEREANRIVKDILDAAREKSWPLELKKKP